MSDQRVAPDATTLRASATATSAVGRVAWTTSASGTEYAGGGARVAGGGPTLGEVDVAGAEEAPAGSDGRKSSPVAWQPTSSNTTSAANPARAVIPPD
jgi:hypothetical protein